MTEYPSLTSTDASTKLALEGVQVHSKISGFTQDVKVEQRYKNDSSKSIEAVYTFPLPEDAVIHSFEIRKGDSVIFGEIESNEKSQDLYEDAISDGHSAYLMESHRPDIFSTLVGNLGAGETVAIEIQYLTTLKPMDEEVRLSYPATVAPRYAPQSTQGSEAVMDAEFVNPPHAQHVPYGLEVQIDIDKTFPLTEVESPSHKLTVSKDTSGQTTIQLREERTEMNDDVIVCLQLERQEEPVALSSRGPDGTPYVTMAFYPEFDFEETNETHSETIFILDASGSMGGYGRSYHQAQQALELSLRSLRIGDTFNIIRFGSTYEKWKPVPQRYSEETLKDALNYIKNSQADLGGTELLSPLVHLFKQEVPEGGVRQVLLLTDGQVSNEDAVHQLAQEYASQNRIFTFGIGNSSSEHLVRGIAQATGGVAEFISDNERIEPVVLRTFSRMGTPIIQDIHLEFEGSTELEYDIGTKEFLPIFDGDAYIMHAEIKGGTPSKVVLSGNGPSGPLQWEATIQIDEGGNASNHHKFWASQKIKTLEFGKNPNHHQSPFAKRRESRQENRIVDLSKKHGVLCRNTSFVAVEYRSQEDRLSGNPELQRIPVQLPCQKDSYLTSHYPVEEDCPFGGGYILPSVEEKRSALVPDRVFAKMASKRRSEPHPHKIEKVYSVMEEAPTTPNEFDGLMDLLNLQQSEGAFYPFDATDEYEDRIQEVLKSEGIDSNPEIVDTLCVLKKLNDEFRESDSVWKRAASKALAYLLQKLGPSNLDKVLTSLGLDKILAPKQRANHV